MQEHPETRFVVSPFKDKLMILLCDPALVKEFLVKEAAFTCKDPKTFKIFHKSAEAGLTFASGDRWVNQREFITATFNNDFIENFIPTVQQTVKEWIGHNFKDESNTVDVVKKSRWFAAKIGAKLFFGDHSFSSPYEFKTFIKAGLENHATWMQIKSSPWRFIFGSKLRRLGLRSIDRQYNRQVKILDRMYNEKIEQFKKIIQEKQSSENAAPKMTLLELFLDQNAKNPEKKMSDTDIVGQISTFFSAETNATTALLTSALYFLAKNKDVQKKLRLEIQENYEKSKEVNFEVLSSMEYLDSFLKETLRMQTPTSLLYQRKVKENMSLLDLKLRKGDRVNVDVLGIGYNPKLFFDPTLFQPNRWIEKKDPGVTEQFAHIPFSDGSFKCPGQQFALTQSKVFICELLKKFNLGFETSPNIRLGFDYVYHISSPLEIRFTKIGS